MKRTMMSLLMIGLSAGYAASAIAQNVSPEAQASANANNKAASEASAAKDSPGMNADEAKSPGVNPAPTKPGMSAKETGPSKSDAASSAVWKAEYKAAKQKAQSDFKDAKANCDTLQESTRSACMKNATAARKEALAQAKMQMDSHTGMNGRPARPTEGDLGRPATEARNTQ